MQKQSAAVWNGAKAFWKQFRPGPEAEIDGGWERPVLGLALGGGFARGVAHIGVIRVLEREHIPLRAVAGVSGGSIVAACLAGWNDHCLRFELYISDVVLQEAARGDPTAAAKRSAALDGLPCSISPNPCMIWRTFS